MSCMIKAIQTPPRKVLTVLRRVLEACDDLAFDFAKKLDKMSLDIDDVRQTLGELAQQNPGINAELQPGEGKRRPKKEQPHQAPTYFASVKLSWALRGAKAAIDGRSVHLSPKLGMLLEILLAEDGSPSGNSRNGWKARKELALRLGKQTGHRISKHALENLISRLKKELQDQAGLGTLVQCERRLGVRVALQKYAFEPAHTPPHEVQPQFEQYKQETVYGTNLVEIPQ